MTSNRTSIWFLREADADDPYEAVFDGAGFAVRSIPVLRFERVGMTVLYDRLRHPEYYGGVIITSPRAAEIFSDGLDELTPELEEKWVARPAFTVGPRTATGLRERGFRPVGEESGTGEKLAKLICETYRADLPLLFLAGNRRRPELPYVLDENGIQFEELTIYHTSPSSPLPAGPGPEWVAVFSPSGVEAWLQQEPLPGIQYAAIGPTTASALEDAGLPVDAVAAEPTPEGLLSAVMRSSEAQQ